MMRQPAKAIRAFQQHSSGWLTISLIGAAMILLPIVTIIAAIWETPSENWSHIKEYMLFDHAVQSFLLVLYTGALTVPLGAALAWLIAAYRFPLHSFYRWALVLPLAIPPYIAAFTYSNMLSYTGTVQKTLRSLGIAAKPAWFDIMNMQGAVLIFTLFLFPYVYLITRSFLERQSGSYIENARLLGRGPLAIFTRIVLPLARPALAAGGALVAFEVLSDYGVVNYFGVPTFTIAIFKTWFGMYDIDSATRLAAWFLVIVLGIVTAERWIRRNRRYSATTARSQPLVPKRLVGWRGWLASALCGGVFAFSFLFPVLQLFVWAGWTYADITATASFWKLASNSVSVAVLSTALIVVLAVIVANTSRMLRGNAGHLIAKLTTAGYAIPGAIIAIGVLIVFVSLDRLLAPLYGIGAAPGSPAPLVLSMSLAMLVTGYVIRFMATGYNAVEAGFEKIGSKYFEASRMLGAGVTRTFFLVDLPMLRGAIGTGLILTFVEVVKELPLALLLRPFNFDTLATKAYQYANDERVYNAAVPSLLIIAVSLIAILALSESRTRRLKP